MSPVVVAENPAPDLSVVVAVEAAGEAALDSVIPPLLDFAAYDLDSAVVVRTTPVMKVYALLPSLPAK